MCSVSGGFKVDGALRVTPHVWLAKPQGFGSWTPGCSTVLRRPEGENLQEEGYRGGLMEGEAGLNHPIFRTPELPGFRWAALGCGLFGPSPGLGWVAWECVRWHGRRVEPWEKGSGGGTTGAREPSPMPGFPSPLFWITLIRRSYGNGLFSPRAAWVSMRVSGLDWPMASSGSRDKCPIRNRWRLVTRQPTRWNIRLIWW